MNDGEAASAFVPGHVTGFFSAHPASDSARAGSRGAGVTLTDGVTVTVSPAAETSVSLDGEPVSVEAVTATLDALGTTARVEATTPLPLGSGFGVSGAFALGTALAANQCFDAGRSENDLVRVAHVADVEAMVDLLSSFLDSETGTHDYAL